MKLKTTESVISILLLIFLPMLTKSQELATIEPCGFTQSLQQMQFIDMEAYIEMITKSQTIQTSSLKTSATVYTLPIVVHVIHNGDAVGVNENISDAQVLSQINALNDDFRRTNADASSTPSAFAGVAADVEIEFCIATNDPNGNPSTGIDRYLGTQASYTKEDIDNIVKPATIWDRDKYINIWIVNFASTVSVNGYAYLPSSAPSMDYLDGLVIRYDCFGTTGTLSSINNLGRTATHEMGHYFNLLHIWGDEPSCTSDDLCGDTPQQKSNNYGCPSFPLTTGVGASCSGGSGAMFMNYMDYCNDACKNLFTQDQKTRMVNSLLTDRAGLLTSVGCTPLPAPAITNFVASSTSICAGANVSFTNLTYFGETYTWNFPGGTPSSSTATNPTVVYNTPGTYSVTLTAHNTLGSYPLTITNMITVNACPSATCQKMNNTIPSSVQFYYIPGDGWITGHNDFLDKAKADYFNYVGSPTQVQKMRVRFLKAYTTSPTGFVKFTVWDNDGAGGTPNTVLGSTNVLIQDIADSINNTTSPPTYYYTLTFPTPVNINSSFYAGVELLYPSTSGADTVVVVTTDDVDGITLPFGATAWSKSSASSWSSISALFGLDIAHHIFPIIGNTPSASFTPSVSSVCSGSSVSLSNSSTAATTYSWSMPSGSPSSSTSTNPSVVYNTAGSKTITLTASNSCGSNTTSQTINVNAAPTPSISTSASTICDGEPTTLTGSGGGAGATYSWIGPAFSSSSSAVTVYPNTPSTFVLSVTNASGCSANTSTLINVETPPVLNIVGYNNICTGNSTNLSISSAPAGTYTWVPSTGLSTASGSSVIASPAANTAYTVNFDNGVCLSSASVSITVSTPPSIIANGDVFCLGDIFPATIQASSPSTGLFQWNTGDTAHTVSLFPSTTTVYTATWTDGMGCSTSDTATMLVDNYPAIPVISQSGTDLSITASGTIQWYENGTLISGANNSLYTPLNNGSYSVSVTNASGCTTYSSVPYVVTWVGINELLGSQILIYPNPYKNSFEIMSTQSPVKVEIFTIDGSLIYSKENISNTIINSVDWASGVYLLKVTNNEGSHFCKRLIKE